MVTRLRPGDRLPTQNELMRQFQVSDTTVLRSLEDLRRAGWIVRRRGSGTFVADSVPAEPVPSAGEERAATAASSGLVAVLSRPIDSPLFAELLQAVEANLSSIGLAPVLIVDADRRQRIARARAQWEQGTIVGAIHLGSAPLSGIGDLPTILLGETVEDNAFCQVSVDNAAAGRQVADYLWDLGHRRAAVVGLGGYTEIADRDREGVDHVRLSAFRARWVERGGGWRDGFEIVHRHFLRLDGDERGALDAMRARLEPLYGAGEEASAAAPTAIFAVHDEMATVTIRALEELGWRVPEDVSVIGFNDTGSLAAYFRPSLTTVRTHVSILGTLAVHLFQDLLRYPAQKPRSVRLPPEIIPRESTGPAPLPWSLPREELGEALDASEPNDITPPTTLTTPPHRMRSSVTRRFV